MRQLGYRSQEILCAYPAVIYRPVGGYRHRQRTAGPDVVYRRCHRADIFIISLGVFVLGQITYVIDVNNIVHTLADNEAAYPAVLTTRISRCYKRGAYVRRKAPVSICHGICRIRLHLAAPYKSHKHIGACAGQYLHLIVYLGNVFLAYSDRLSEYSIEISAASAAYNAVGVYLDYDSPRLSPKCRSKPYALDPLEAAREFTCFRDRDSRL